jgi:putative ABC transport system substrate-binding protein
MMKRRTFIAAFGGAAAWPVVAWAQQAGKLPVIGLLSPGSEIVDRERVTALVQRLRELGWIEGRSVAIEYRFADGVAERAGEIVSEFVRLPVDIIVTAGDVQDLAAKQATTVIPIVMVAGDPVGNGLVASLARPGGNVTGLSLALSDIASRRLQLLRETIPSVRRAAIFGNFANPTIASEFDAVRAAARALDIDVTNSEIRRLEDVPPAIEALKDRAEAIYVCGDPLMNTLAPRINALALSARLPVAYNRREGAEAGGLISYGPDRADLWRRLGGMVDKILRGTKPADIPVEQPIEFDLVVNLKTAKALGLAIPPTLLARAEEVIE